MERETTSSETSGTGAKHDTENNTEHDTKDGVTVRASSAEIRGEAGRFLPGVSGNPLGRPKKQQETAVLEALTARVSPALVADTIYDLITSEKSFRARALGVELYLNYTIGKPVQRVLEDGDSLDIFLARLRSSRSE